MNMLMICLLLMTAEEKTYPTTPLNNEDSITLVVAYDNSEASRKMFPALAKLRQMGYNIVYADIQKEDNAQHLRWFEINQINMPCYLMYMGHEAFEKCSGQMTEYDIAMWYHRAFRGERTPQMRQPTEQNKYLQNSELNKVYLKQRLTPGSCGMLGCQAHGGGVILEQVDGNGRVIY